MRIILLFGFLLSLIGCQQKTIMVNKVDGCPVTLNHSVRMLNGEQTVNLCKEYHGKVVLIINTASKCAFTDQYDGLEKLYAKYKEQGLVVLGATTPDKWSLLEPHARKMIESVRLFPADSKAVREWKDKLAGKKLLYWYLFRTLSNYFQGIVKSMTLTHDFCDLLK